LSRRPNGLLFWYPRGGKGTYLFVAHIRSNIITSKTTLLAVGKRPGQRKLGMALDRDISIISAEDFMALLDLDDTAIEA